MEELEDYIDEGMSPEERQAAEEVMEGLAMLRRQEAVQAAASERARLRRRPWRWWLVSLLLILGSVSYILWNKDRPSTSTSDTSITEPREEMDQSPSPPTGQGTPTAAEEKASEEENESRTPITPEQDSPPPPPPPVNEGPIARANIPPPAFPAPASFTRGSATDERLDKALLDQVWYTEYPLQDVVLDSSYIAIDGLLRERAFPRAYVGLQRMEREGNRSDTLLYLQGYTLLEMGQGGVAFTRFSQIENPPPAWQQQLDWYRALSLLFDQQYEAALVNFKAISQEPAHHYFREARKAIRLLE